MSISVEDAEEYTQALGQVVAGGWRQIALGKRLGVPQALGLGVQEWVETRLGGYVRMSIEDRRQAVVELAAEGESAKAISDITGVDRKTVRKWTAGEIPTETNSDGEESQVEGPADVDDGEIPMPANQEQADAILADIDKQVAERAERPYQLIPDGRRYCKYCYGEHPLAIGEDGSLIVCGSCGAGLAPLVDVEDCGGYDAWLGVIEREFGRVAAGHAQPERAAVPAAQLNEGDEWYTPRWLFDALGIEKYWADVCAPLDRTHSSVPAERYFTVEDDGLAEPWHGTVWCNPPYSKPEPWARRMIHHRDGLLLTHIPMNAGWCIEMWEACDAIRLFQAMEFVRPDGSLQRPGYWLQLAAFGPVATEALARLQPLGQAAANKRRVASPMWRRAA